MRHNMDVLASDTNSPHFNDQAQRYVDMEFKDVPYYKEEILKVAKETYNPGKRD